jgi:hypothetical protein
MIPRASSSTPSAPISPSAGPSAASKTTKLQKEKKNKAVACDEPKKAKVKGKRRYDDAEAACSDGSQDELEDEVDEYDYEDGFLEKEEESGDEDAVRELRAKQMMEDDSTRSKAKQLPKFKAVPEETSSQPAGNKKLKTWMPTEKPAKTQKARMPEYRWCFLITDPKSFKNFLRAASAGGSLPALHFRFEVKTSASGETSSFLTLQAFDSPPTMGYYSSMKIILHAGVDENNKPLSIMDLNGVAFGATSSNLEKGVKWASAPNPSAPLQMMLFNNLEDVIVIKSESDGSVMDASFKIPLNKKTASESPIPALMLRSAKEMEEKRRFKCRISSNLLRNIADTANSIDSGEIRFDLFSGQKESDENISKHKLSVLFNGESNRIQGEHNFYINTIVRRPPQLFGVPLFSRFSRLTHLFALRLTFTHPRVKFMRSKKKKTMGDVIQMEPVVSEEDGDNKTKWIKMSSQAYSTTKFRMFLSNMNVEWLNFTIGTSPEARDNIPLEMYSDGDEEKMYVTIAALEEDN